MRNPTFADWQAVAGGLGPQARGQGACRTMPAPELRRNKPLPRQRARLLLPRVRAGREDRPRHPAGDTGGCRLVAGIGG